MTDWLPLLPLAVAGWFFWAFIGREVVDRARARFAARRRNRSAGLAPAVETIDDLSTGRLNRRIDRLERRSTRNLALIGMLIFIATGLGVALYLGQDRADRRQAEDRAEAIQQNADLIDRIQASRLNGTLVSCKARNADRAAIRAIILGGVEASKAYEAIYRQFGLPPFAERLAAAQRTAQTLPDLDCEAEVERARVPVEGG